MTTHNSILGTLYYRYQNQYTSGLPHHVLYYSLYIPISRRNYNQFENVGHKTIVLRIIWKSQNNIHDRILSNDESNEQIKTLFLKLHLARRQLNV